jgi:hypothetical protein
MPPGFQQINMMWSDFPLREKQVKNFRFKDTFQILKLNKRRGLK